MLGIKQQQADKTSTWVFQGEYKALNFEPSFQLNIIDSGDFERVSINSLANS